MTKGSWTSETTGVSKNCSVARSKVAQCTLISCLSKRMLYPIIEGVRFQLEHEYFSELKGEEVTGRIDDRRPLQIAVKELLNFLKLKV